MLHLARRTIARVAELVRGRSRYTAELDEEFEFHVEMETAENMRRGMSAADARRAALVRFGGLQRFREEAGSARGIVAFERVARDFRLAIRRVKRSPGFSSGVIATLGIGIGAAVGIGSIVYGVLLRDLPYNQPDQLVRVGFVTEGIGTVGDLHSEATFVHLARTAQSFTELGAYWSSDAFTVVDGDAPERVDIAMMTPSVFTMLGVRPVLGRLFSPDDTSWSKPGTPILISEEFWTRRYGADSSIIGRRIDIDRGERFVIGVLPRSFAFPTSSVDIYYPAAIPVDRPQITARSFNVIGRLRNGVSASTAESELRVLVPAMAERFPEITRDMLQRSRARGTVVPLDEAMIAQVRAQLIVLGVLVGVVLLIALTNIANLFLLRTERASQEIAIVLSLGVSRLALVQRFVIEGIVLGILSSLVAIPVAALALSTKFGFTEREIPRLHEVMLTGETIALVFVVASLIGAAVGAIALTRMNVTGLFDRLRSSRSTTSRAWRHVRDGLVAFQVAVALVLLVASALLGRSLWNLRDAEIGFDASGAMTFHVSLPWRGYRTYADNAAFHAKLSDRLAEKPGIGSVGAASRIPLASTGDPELDTQLQAADDVARAPIASAVNMASAEYFRAMGIPLRAGRTFQSGDLRGEPAVIVSERLAEAVFGTTSVVGRQIKRLGRGGAPPRTFTIVGVAGDVHWARIEAGYAPMLYFPLLRDGDGLSPDSIPVYKPRDVYFVMRGSSLPSPSMIREMVQELDDRVPATNIRTLGALVDDATARVRLTMLLIAFAGVSALLLGVIGVHSVVSYAAAGRTREFGIRIALGAAPTRIARMVLGDGLRLVAIGTVSGVLAALGATRLLRSLLYEVTATSLTEFGVATALLVGVTVFASALPARRSARTNPAVVLRGE